MAAIKFNKNAFKHCIRRCFFREHSLDTVRCAVTTAASVVVFINTIQLGLQLAHHIKYFFSSDQLCIIAKA